MRLSDDERGLLAAHILADPSNALALHRENPSLVEEAMLDPGLLARLSGDPVLFATLILGLKPTPYQLRFLNSSSKRIIIRWPRQSGKTLSLAACIGYLKVLGERWSRVRATYVDSTKHGDYIVRDMAEAGVRGPRGVFLTQDVKQEAAQMLRQRLAEGVLRIPFDRGLLDELNLEQYELTRTGRVALTHAPGTHDDRFWALALAVYATEKGSHPSRPMAQVV